MPEPITTHAPPQHEPKECRSCRQPILWAQVLGPDGKVKCKPDGKAQVMPVDFKPSGAGNVRVFDRGGSLVARVLTNDEAEQERAKADVLGADARLRTAHFAGCPEAKKWRTRK